MYACACVCNRITGSADTEDPSTGKLRKPACDRAQLCMLTREGEQKSYRVSTRPDVKAEDSEATLEQCEWFSQNQKGFHKALDTVG